MLVRLILLVSGASLALAQQFPPVKDWDSVRITLERTDCFGSCPVYDVEIRDGVVRYWGGHSTLVRGQHLGQMMRPELQQLIDEFRRADYMKLNSKYGNLILDAPAYTISASIDGASNTIADYTGFRGGEPAVVIALENSVDRLGHAAKWTVGNNETIPALRREGFKFTSPQASAIIAWALKGDREWVRELVQTDAPLNGPIPDWTLSPLILAAWNRDPEVLRLLIKAGASKNDEAVKKQALEVAIRAGNRDAIGALEAYLRQ